MQKNDLLMLIRAVSNNIIVLKADEGENVKMREREYNMDYLRILSCLLIVLLHFSSSYWNCVPIDSSQFAIMTGYNCITRVGVPIFFMLSGYFLLDRDYLFNWKSYLRRPAFLLISVYIWSAFYAFQGIIVEMVKTGDTSSERIKYSIDSFIFGHYHMWFCFLLIGYYILFPIAKKIAEDKKVLNLFLVLWVLFAFVIPSIISWLNLELTFVYMNKFELNLLKGYWGYFFLGYGIKIKSWKKLEKVAVYFMGIISLIITYLLTIYQSSKTGTYVETWFSTGSIFVLAMSIALFLLFKSVPINEDSKMNKKVVAISQCSFFVYMFHVFILEKLNMIGITTISFAPIF